MRFLAYRNICRNALEVVLVDERNGVHSVARPVEFILDRHEEGAVVEPTMVIPAGAAESLMQALWDAGLRPNNGEGSSGQVAALKAHIAFAERVADRILAATPTVSASQEQR